MPELPEVETVRRGLSSHLEGHRFVRVLQRRADLRLPFPDRFAARLEGRRVEGTGRRGKYLLIHLDDGNSLIVHLGMSGRLVIGDRRMPPKAHDHAVFETDNGCVITYNDHRRFGLMILCPTGALGEHPLLRSLGPEPLASGFDGAVLAARLKGKRTPIKAALLDQKVVAGLGNIYASESLFRAGLSPRRRAYTVQGARARRLAQAIRAVLEDAIAAGGSSLRDYVQVDGELGYFQHRFAVYGREGEPCPGCDCQAGIRHLVQTNRSTYYCPKRQR
ncbi:MAG: bifunctional DNA-formamidopyrimidine glycosylase/DNA-(apurinic or apyrimidinic site) lyase [Alphaproteobacteria bacterium]|nr:bifunctional DNA-formamidopyrimidine glycosylase/DNA-(apurinic or apyrimidinic site) lyase [Pseudomonadota bacterium]